MTKILSAVLALIAIFPVASCALEIRGPLELVIDGIPYELGPKVTDSEFYGFYYDIDDNLGTESIELVISKGNVLDGDTYPAGIRYVTEAQDNNFTQEDWGSYKSIGFLGENFFAGYVKDDDPNKMSILAKKSDETKIDTLSKGALFRVLIDEDDEGLIQMNNPLQLKDGYELRLASVDYEGNSARVDLYKGEELLDSKAIFPEREDSTEEDKTYYYRASSGDSTGLVTIAVHFDRVFKAGDRDIASFDGTFQLSEEPILVKDNQVYDNMTVTSRTSSTIVMENRDKTITLNEGKDILLMSGFRIRTADQETWDQFEDPLRFYVYREITDPGQYLINGRVEDLVNKRDASWDYTNFAGFFYDLDEDLGSERLDMIITGDGEESSIEPGDVTYRTESQVVPFDYRTWGSYYAIGYMGEKCLASYVTREDGRTAFLRNSDDANLLASDIISRVLKDDDGTIDLAEGSVLPLDEGYELRIDDIDFKGKRVLVILAKDGKEMNRSIVDVLREPTYIYRTKQGNDEIPLIAINFEDLLGGVETSIAEINGTWQISEKFEAVGKGKELGRIEIVSVNSGEGDMSIRASNEKDINLGKDKEIDLMGNFGIKTADQKSIESNNPLRFSIFKNVTIG